MGGGELAVAVGVVVAAAVVQAGTGAGFGLISAPLLALLDREFVPGPVLALTVVICGVGAWRERGALVVRDLRGAAVASVPGMVVGVWALSVLDATPIALVTGVVIGAAVIAAWCGARIPATPFTLSAAGGLSGFLGTLIAAPGPPVSLVYRPSEAPRLRANLSAYFAVTAVVTLVLLGAAGKFGRADAIHAAVLLPAGLTGAVLGGRLGSRLSGRTVGQAVLAVAFASAVVVTAKAVAA
ncbi:TSUP family transporter [Yinghuangia sp. YIM S09857]|uniref:TSUP family transporter n=1 Tax=Yinghuangia sp. YIM S09857 TaxID=3436929 RepID=UPI003F5339E8